MNPLLQRMQTLTPAEREVLDLLIAGLLNKDIAVALKIGLRTVELRRSKIMRKLEASTAFELARLVSIGEVLAEPAKFGLMSRPEHSLDKFLPSDSEIESLAARAGVPLS